MYGLVCRSLLLARCLWLFVWLVFVVSVGWFLLVVGLIVFCSGALNSLCGLCIAFIYCLLSIGWLGLGFVYCCLRY